MVVKVVSVVSVASVVGGRQGTTKNTWARRRPLSGERGSESRARAAGTVGA